MCESYGRARAGGVEEVAHEPVVVVVRKTGQQAEVAVVPLGDGGLHLANEVGEDGASGGGSRAISG